MATPRKAATFLPAPAGAGTGDMNQGTPKLLGKFVATAYGPPWVGIQGTGVTADGTNLRNAPHIYGVAVDPKVIPLGTALLIQPNPFNWNGTFKAFDTGGAIKGNRIDFYDWRGRTSQRKWGTKQVSVYKSDRSDATMNPPATGGGISLPSIPNPISAVDDAAKTIAEFVRFMLSPTDIASLLARVAAYFIKLFFKALWSYIVAPVLHWQQRATQWYYSNILLENGGRVDKLPSGVPAFVTLSFWATGFAILWARADGNGGGLATSEPQRTPVGRMVRAFGNTVARRKLVKPKDVKKKTPQKPTPQESATHIDMIRRVAATQTRQVKVTGSELPEGEMA